ncbi:von Willebrand factor D and EGF domain-containing protein-like [Branchiostoma floridae]|uniref:von Willebrand factor D and EGF domain-containing protein-like n=1 Tax=Branchiostoma floridae TaxID=7739 RepID=A0A9J7HU27_BRAFL|nr:von Willebrand factor D and EGF domain-containing protein-like [Branchiostoma floridae]
MKRITGSVCGCTGAWLAVLAAVWAVCRGQEAIPECAPSGHVVLDNPYRSVAVADVPQARRICDRDLQPGWYRLQLHGKDAQIPTQCVQMNHCGTQAPIWLSLGDGSLPTPGETGAYTGCVVWGFPGQTPDCCLLRMPVKVRNCGDYFVYHLQPAQGCMMAYCAVGERAKCQPGMYSADGYEPCRKPHPTLTATPFIRPAVIGRTVYLNCSHRSEASDESGDVEYEVTWFRERYNGERVEITMAKTQQPYSLLRRGAQWRVGETVLCKVQAYYIDPPELREAGLESAPFFAGMKIYPLQSVIQENGKAHELTFELTVPVVCQSDICRLRIPLNVRDKDGALPPDIALTECTVEIPSQPCTPQHCGKHVVHMSAVTDFVADGKRKSVILTQEVKSEDQNWLMYDPENIEVVVEDVPTARCYSFTDPHVITMDGTMYDSYKAGTFIMYKSTSRDFEVHGRAWNCGSPFRPVACHCGFVARENADVISVDMCDGNPGETTAQVRVKSELPLAPGVEITEMYDGKRVVVFFPSGAFVRADIAGWGMSLTLQAPGRDFNSTRGLCGTFDGNDKNDFHDSQGRLMAVSQNFGQVIEFVEQWRLPVGMSMFDKLPEPRDYPPLQSFCACADTSDDTSQPDGFGDILSLINRLPDPGSKCNPVMQTCPEEKCDRRDHVRKATVINSPNLTANYSNKISPRNPTSPRERTDFDQYALLGGEHTLNERPHSSQGHMTKNHTSGAHISKNTDFLSVLNEEDLLVPAEVDEKNPALNEHGVPIPSILRDFRRRHRHSGHARAGNTNPLQSHTAGRRHKRQDINEFFPFEGNEIDFESGSYFFPGDFILTDLSPVIPRWPTTSGKTDGEVRKICISNLLNATVGEVCGDVLGNKVNNIIEICIKDVLLTDDTSWARDALPLLEAQCEEAALRDVSLWEKDEQGVLVPNRKITRFLNCPNSCSGHGACTDDGCLCDAGFTSYDCSVSQNEAPQVFGLEQNGLCDIRMAPCTRVGALGRGFRNQPGMGCLVAPVTYSEGSWRLSGAAIFTQATFVNFRSVSCEIPASPVTVSGGRSETSGWQIKVPNFFVSNDGSTFSEAALFVTYDSVCQDCDQSIPGLCKIKNNTCIINGRCYGSREPRPGNKCEQCLPHKSTENWSVREGNLPPVLQVPVEVASFVGEDFVYELKAVDPEGSQILFSLLTRNDEIMLTPVGLLMLKPERALKQPVEFTITDECNSISRFEITVDVKPCECENGGSCVTDIKYPAGSGMYMCVCPPGYQGERCQDNVDHCNPNPCLHGDCVNTKGGFACDCERGYTGDRCDEDIDECAEKPCYPGVQCVDLVGSFSCGKCPVGMMGTGIQCTDINSCASGPCFAGVACHDKRAPQTGYTCGSCPPGFHGDGVTCEYTPVQEHRIGLPVVLAPVVQAGACASNPCFPGAQCEPLPDGYICGQCPEGYTGNGKECFAMCDWPCMRNMVCVGLNTCACREGYSGYQCRQAVCKPDCKNRGRCVKPNVCSCMPGYLGPTCEQAECVPPCDHGGKCIARNVCSCPYGYVGPRCETMLCRHNCQNGGVCVAPDVCKCPAGFVGLTCETADCTPACRNGGVCTRPGLCACPPGFFGRRCERGVCRPKCQNGGDCMRRNMCHCKPGYTGSRCQFSICEPRCQNGGKCVKANRCSCKSGFTGRRCEKAICVNRCRNGGSCVKPNACACPAGFKGAVCQTAVCKRRCLYGGRCVGPNRCYCRPGRGGPYCNKRIRR